MIKTRVAGADGGSRVIIMTRRTVAEDTRVLTATKDIYVTEGDMNVSVNPCKKIPFPDLIRI